MAVVRARFKHDRSSTTFISCACVLTSYALSSPLSSSLRAGEAEAEEAVVEAEAEVGTEAVVEAEVGTEVEVEAEAAEA